MSTKYSALSTYSKKGAQASDLVPFSGDLSQSQKLSEIKPPLDDVVFWAFPILADSQNHPS